MNELWPMLQNFFQCNYVAAGVTSVRIIWKYAASGVNYAKKFYNIVQVRRDCQAFQSYSNVCLSMHESSTLGGMKTNSPKSTEQREKLLSKSNGSTLCPRRSALRENTCKNQTH
jgi:hypothetical protein